MKNSKLEIVSIVASACILYAISADCEVFMGLCWVEFQARPA